VTKLLSSNPDILMALIMGPQGRTSWRAGRARRPARRQERHQTHTRGKPGHRESKVELISSCNSGSISTLQLRPTLPAERAKNSPQTCSSRTPTIGGATSPAAPTIRPAKEATQPRTPIRTKLLQVPPTLPETISRRRKTMKAMLATEEAPIQEMMINRYSNK
jgi:hypothetical protein